MTTMALNKEKSQLEALSPLVIPKATRYLLMMSTHLLTSEINRARTKVLNKCRADVLIMVTLSITLH